MGGRETADRAERARERTWVIARLQVGLAAFWVLLAASSWFVDDATWQPPVFSVLGVAYLISALVSLREQRRRRAREQGPPGAG